MTGRPRALNEIKRREVCALVTAGCGLEGAANYVGCNVITIRREAMRNADFYEQLRQAELGAQLSPLQAMRKAADTHWRAAAWYLERTQPNQFARRNMQRFTECQFSRLLAQYFKMIVDEIEDSETVGRVCRRVQEFSRENNLKYRAIVAPRPDVHSRQKEMLERLAEREKLEDADETDVRESRRDAISPNAVAPEMTAPEMTAAGEVVDGPAPDCSPPPEAHPSTASSKQ